MGVAHVALDLGLRRERGNRIDDDDIHGAGTRLGNQQFLHVDAQLLRVERIQRMLGIDEGRGAALLLALGQHLQRQRGLARGFRAIDLDHPPLRQATDAQGNVQGQGAGGYRFHVAIDGAVAHAHDRTLAELFLDLAQRRGERPAPRRAPSSCFRPF